MIHKSHSILATHVRITFELPSCIWADRIYLVGDFNHWREDATPMRQERDGVWRASLDLPCGYRYEFRYKIDGQWKTDSHADGFAFNHYGTENSVVVAELPKLAPLEWVSSQVRDTAGREFATSGEGHTTHERTGHYSAPFVSFLRRTKLMNAQTA